MTQQTKLILLGGTSHVGKSTFGRRLAEELNWNYLSTDQLARHPGRPWRSDASDVPDDVVAHFTTLTTHELSEAVLEHYRINVWPIVDAIIRSRLNNPFEHGLIFEGSAILPKMISEANYERVRAAWLTAPVPVITERLRANSEYDRRTPAERVLIDAFLQRSIALDEVFRDAARRTNQMVVDTSEDNAYPALRSLI